VLLCEALAQAGALLIKRSAAGLPKGRWWCSPGWTRAVPPAGHPRGSAPPRGHHREAAAGPLWKMSGRAYVGDTLVAEAELTLTETRQVAL